MKLKINWYRLFPWAYTALCWTLIGFAVSKADWRYLYALLGVVLTFFISLFCVGKAGKTRFT